MYNINEFMYNINEFMATLTRFLVHQVLLVTIHVLNTFLTKRRLRLAMLYLFLLITTEILIYNN